jgi:hypothetical protein
MGITDRIVRPAHRPLCTGLTVAAAQKSDPAPITEASFKCIRTMTPVRGFYVDNLQGNLKGTVAAANSANGAVYPLARRSAVPTR